MDAAPRLNELLELVEQAPGKCLIFCPFTSIVNIVHRKLKERWSIEKIYGDVTERDRARIFDAFQKEDHPRLLVADPQTMAHGLDLWRAQTTIWFGPTDKAEIYQQANRRMHRPGQTFPSTVVQIVSNPLEREIYKRLESNTALQGALLDVIRRGEL